MKYSKIHFYKSRKFLTTFLALLIAVGLIILFSSWTLITLPFRDSFIQININKGFNAFFPRDKTSLFYFHNSIRPQIITDANTSYEGMESLPYFQIHLPFNLSKFPEYSLPDQLAQLPVSEVSNTIQKVSQSNPISKTNTITAKEFNITFTLPPTYYLEYKSKSADNPETININNGPQGLKDNWMSIQVYESHKFANCSQEKGGSYRTPTKTITVAGKWSMMISKNDSRYGSREHQGTTCLDNNKVLMMYRYVKDDGNQAETDFDKILETAIYKP